MFTVKELKEAIANLPDDMEVIVQADPEGNNYRRCYTVDPNCVFDENNWCVYSLEWTAKEACRTPEEWDEIRNRPKCLVIAPE